MFYVCGFYYTLFDGRIRTVIWPVCFINANVFAIENMSPILFPMIQTMHVQFELDD